MKKPTMIIGKKQIILAGMTLILGLAVYINYAVSTSDGKICLLYTSPSPRDISGSRMPSSA